MMRRKWRIAAAMAILSVLAGCLTRAAPVKQSYVLQAARAQSAPVQARSPGALKVDLFRVAAAFQGRGLVYRKSEVGYESDYYHEFLAPPAALVREAATAWLAASGVFSPVLPVGSASDARYHFEGLVTELYADVRAAKPLAVVAIHFYLSDGQTALQAVLFDKLIRREVSLADSAPATVAAGFNRALAQVLTQLEGDLSALAPRLPPR